MLQVGNLSDSAAARAVSGGLLPGPAPAPRDLGQGVQLSRARGLNKFIVTIAFDSSSVEYLDLDRVEEGWNVLTQVPNMRYGLSGAGLSSHGDTLLVTGGVGRGGILKALTRWGIATSAHTKWTLTALATNITMIPFRFLTFNVRTNMWTEGPPIATPRKV